MADEPVPEIVEIVEIVEILYSQIGAGKQDNSVDLCQQYYKLPKRQSFPSAAKVECLSYFCHTN